MIEIKNVGEVTQTIDRWLADVEAMTTRFCRGVSVTLFEKILHNSVQYSGDFAANWKYEINSITPEFKAGAIPEFHDQEGAITWTHGKAGDRLPFFSRFRPMDERGLQHLAISYAVRANRTKDAAFKLGDTIYIHNSAAHDEPYAQKIESEQINFRVKGSGAPVKTSMSIVVNMMTGGLGMMTGEGVVDYAGYKAVTQRTQIDSMRRRPTADMKG